MPIFSTALFVMNRRAPAWTRPGRLQSAATLAVIAFYLFAGGYYVSVLIGR